MPLVRALRWSRKQSLLADEKKLVRKDKQNCREVPIEPPANCLKQASRLHRNNNGK